MAPKLKGQNLNGDGGDVDDGAPLGQKRLPLSLRTSQIALLEMTPPNSRSFQAVVTRPQLKKLNPNAHQSQMKVLAFDLRTSRVA